MSNQLPYEESLRQQLGELPLPDEEQSWQKMKTLLEEDEDDNRIIPPPLFLKGCAGGGILLVLLLIGWLVFHWGAKNEQTQKQQQTTLDSSLRTDKNKTLKQGGGVSGKTEDQKSTSSKKDSMYNGTALPYQKDSIQKSSRQLARDSSNPKPNNKINKIGPSNRPPGVPVTKALIAKKAKMSKDKNNISNGDKRSNEPPVDIPQENTRKQEEKGNVVDTDRKNINDTVTHKKDSAGKQAKPIKKDSLTTNAVVKDFKQKPFYFGAGIGLQQQIPLSGQKATPYNYYGREGSLADYIPSVFVRYYKTDDWFIHAGFRYGAPQASKEVVYNQQTKADSIPGGPGGNITTTVFRLQKTFYHQLPLIFNWYALPNWSVGGGFMYSKFYGAVTEQETKKTNISTGIETVSKQIIQVPASTDSFFTQSQIHFLLQIEYQWKRFGGGIRYTMGVQPFIKYIENGVAKEQKNLSLDLFIRYQLWQSKK